MIKKPILGSLMKNVFGGRKMKPEIQPIKRYFYPLGTDACRQLGKNSIKQLTIIQLYIIGKGQGCG
jgi:hypothetical protein